MRKNSPGTAGGVFCLSLRELCAVVLLDVGHAGFEGLDVALKELGLALAELDAHGVDDGVLGDDLRPLGYVGAEEDDVGALEVAATAWAAVLLPMASTPNTRSSTLSTYSTMASAPKRCVRSLSTSISMW